MSARRMQESSQDEAYLLIKESILCCSLRPNERVRAHEIAKKLGVSRTPVREALGRLEQEGLVARDSGWGYLVKGMTFAEVMNLFTVREILEVEAAKGALDRLDAESIKSLGRLLNASERNWRAGKVSEFQKANRAFHVEITRLCGNVFLQMMLSMISDRIRILGAMVLQRNATRGDQMLGENRAILLALEARDVRKLEEGVRAHVQRAREHVLRILQGEFQCVPHQEAA